MSQYTCSSALLERLDGAGSRLNHIRVGVLARVPEGSSLVETQDYGHPLAGVTLRSTSLTVEHHPVTVGSAGSTPV